MQIDKLLKKRNLARIDFKDAILFEEKEEYLMHYYISMKLTKKLSFLV